MKEKKVYLAPVTEEVPICTQYMIAGSTSVSANVDDRIDDDVISWEN